MRLSISFYFINLYNVNNMITSSQLRELGLSENEAKVYLAMLELGPATVLEIAAKALMNRPTVYVQIESLKQRGLVSTQSKGKKQIFIAESPSQLESMLEREQKNLEVKKEELSRMLPDLTTMFNLSDQKPQVRYFEGKAGLEKMRDEFLKTKEKIIYGISSIDQVRSVFPVNTVNIKNYSDRRVEKGIRVMAVYSHKGEPVYTKEENESRLRQVRYIDSDKMKFDADITIFDDSMAIAFLGGSLFGVIISQKEIAESFKNLFKFLWSVAEEK